MVRACWGTAAYFTLRAAALREAVLVDVAVRVPVCAAGYFHVELVTWDWLSVLTADERVLEARGHGGAQKEGADEGEVLHLGCGKLVVRCLNRKTRVDFKECLWNWIPGQ